ncbi:YlmC/YmxH family sporulation protein [Clostridioides difficile]|uniref:YlmC/YmxH family sporulation protein n=1 Tax=Clostridioides difficile TaxID=1496 RepID=UPI001FB228B8|nr:YlmC/YmxH family sporulation protein [Clostridioides difficile]MCP8671764.1 YlmC/YmxH family sporulation protein [Clostridioides difficile]WKK92076.1 YlmC/YmxH family sporulation protein [Clostridioides difficile]
MIRVSDIMEKEIINVKNGKRMGFIIDIDMDIHEGKVVSFTIFGDGSRSFFQEEGMKKLYFGMIYLK